jgi:pimeloyl-ACP methyl ester carboxylesterase
VAFRQGSENAAVASENTTLMRQIPGAEFRVVTLDLPGHGLTGAVPSRDYSEDAMVLFVGEIADALGLKTFAIGGNSMGARIAAPLYGAAS